MKDFLSYIKEDGEGGGAPTNNVGSGNIAGAGVPLAGKPANWGEPGVSKKNQKKHTNILRRKNPLQEGVRENLVARGIPAIKHKSTGKITIGKRGQDHAQLLGFKVGKWNDDIQAALKSAISKHHIGFYDPQTKKFHNRSRLDLDSTELMTDMQRRRYEEKMERLYEEGLMEAEDFAGIKTFDVPSDVYHNARNLKRRGAHWSKYLGNGEHLTNIRSFANKNPKKGIIVRDNRHGGMFFVRYGDATASTIKEARLIDKGIPKNQKWSETTGKVYTPKELSKRYQAVKIGQVGKEHDLYIGKTGDSYGYSDQYIVHHRGTGRVDGTVIGQRVARSGAFHVGTVDATGKGPKMPRVYRAILACGHSKTLVGNEHSPGGQKIWQKLSKAKGVSVYGWYNGKPVNIDPTDETDTHISDDERDRHADTDLGRRGAGSVYNDLRKADDQTYSTNLVASFNKKLAAKRKKAGLREGADYKNPVFMGHQNLSTMKSTDSYDTREKKDEAYILNHVIMNPTFKQLKDLYDDSSYKSIRYLKYKGNCYVMDANEACHGNIASALGIRSKWDMTAWRAGILTGFIDSENIKSISGFPGGLVKWIEARHKMYKNSTDYDYDGVYIPDDNHDVDSTLAIKARNLRMKAVRKEMGQTPAKKTVEVPSVTLKRKIAAKRKKVNEHTIIIINARQEKA